MTQYPEAPTDWNGVQTDPALLDWIQTSQEAQTILEQSGGPTPARSLFEVSTPERILGELIADMVENPLPYAVGVGFGCLGYSVLQEPEKYTDLMNGMTTFASQCLLGLGEIVKGIGEVIPG